MNEIRERKLNKIMNRLNKLVYKDQQGGKITEDELREYKQLEEELKQLGYEHLGNGLIADQQEEE